MSSGASRYDVVVIGGGFAGVTAARDLTQQGCSGQISWKPGRVTRSHSTLDVVEGRLSFATGDIAPTMASSIEGVVVSGHKAAHQALNHLVREREAAAVLVR